MANIQEVKEKENKQRNQKEKQHNAEEVVPIESDAESKA